MAVASWLPEMSAEAWEQAVAAYGALASPLMTAGMWHSPLATPPALPWLAVWITPVMASAPPDAIARFGDLERCVAWALIP